jgi:glycosyltransferase involved in cell wall biosynthesis
VIMSRVGGMPEVISEDVNGLLVEPNDVHALAKAIERLATDWSLADRLGRMGRQIAPASYSLESHVETLMELYALHGGMKPSGTELVHP